jgi:hypothetical protein
MTVASCYAWRRVLQRRAAEKATFVPVQVMPDAVPDRASALPTAGRQAAGFARRESPACHFAEPG